MRTYIIDAFNMIHKVPELVDSLSPHAALIGFIRKRGLRGSFNNRIIIVFDGHEASGINESEFQIVFSKNYTADDVIKRMIEKHSKKDGELIVVSDDNEVRNAARAHDKKYISVEEFTKSAKQKKGAAAGKDPARDPKLDPDIADEITNELKKIWMGK